jgi:hypothetical protein
MPYYLSQISGRRGGVFPMQATPSVSRCGSRAGEFLVTEMLSAVSYVSGNDSRAAKQDNQ